MKGFLSLLCVFLVSAFISEGLSASLPNSIKRCKLSDEAQSLNKCLKEAAQKFLLIIKKPNPDIGLPSFEPLKIPDILSTDPVLNFKFTNNKIVGFTNGTNFEDFELEQNKKRFIITYLNTGQMESDYSLEGRLLLLPVAGKGKSTIEMSGVRFVYKFKYDVVKGKDGLTYWKIIKHSVSFTPGQMKYSFTNLFNGNKVLSDAIHTLVNNNWKELYHTLGKASVYAVTDAFVATISNLFNKVPIGQLFTP